MRITGHLIGAATATALLVFPGSALAKTFNLGVLSRGGLLSQLVDRTSRGNFTDTFRFAVAFNGGATTQFDNFKVVTSGGKTLKNILGETFSLKGPNGFTAVPRHSIMSGDLEAFTLLAGNYVATLSGKDAGSSGGTYNFSVAAPVPDAAGWATMAVGIGLAGLFARRRINA